MDDFFTVASFATLTTTVVAVVAVVNALRHALNWGPRWFGLLLSIAFALVALFVTAAMGETSQTAGLGWIRYLVALINGCVIYTSAFGVQNAVIAPPVTDGVQAEGVAGPGEFSFRSPW
jgi:hypothetical protein